jgi:hypothetical protein
VQPTVPTSDQSAQPDASPTSSAQESHEQLTSSMPPQVLNSDSVSQQQPPAYENIYTEICTEIIKAQSQILGLDVALEQAKGVGGLSVDPHSLHSTVVGDGSKVINDLIEKYRAFFGYAAVEVCREAAAHLLTGLSSEQTPSLLHPPRI